MSSPPAASALDDAALAAYAAATAGVGLVDRSASGKLLLTGAGAAAFLDGQVSNDVAGLAAGEGRYATFLTPKGRVRGDLRVLRAADPLGEHPDGLLLLCERAVLQDLFDLVRRFSIGHDVDVHKRTREAALLSLVGPASLAAEGPLARVAPGAAALGDAPEGAHLTIDTDAGSLLLVRTDRGVDVLTAADRADAAAAALTAAGATPVPEAVDEIVRVESGRPRMGAELGEDVMPAEAGLEERAVSFTKGCYVGQETVARLHWRGRPNRHLRGLRTGVPVAAGDVVLAGDREVGLVRTAVRSPRLGPLALAYLRRDVEPDAEVTVAGVPATATTLPFTPDA